MVLDFGGVTQNQNTSVVNPSKTIIMEYQNSCDFNYTAHQLNVS